MKKLINAFSGKKNIFCQQQNSADCVEFKNAASRTQGRKGPNAENSGGQILYYQWKQKQ